MRFETYINYSIVPKYETDFRQYVRLILSRQHYGKAENTEMVHKNE
jgi:hypothetical protein